MAMRDPGTPGRNPFFDHGPEPEPDVDIPDPYAATADPGDDPYADDPYAEGARAAGPNAGGPNLFGLGGDPLGTLATLVDALQDAQPEATEHLIVAAHELVLAVKTVVDATEAVLAAQRATARSQPRPDARPAGPASEDDDHDPFASDDPPPAPGATPRSGVRRIDLA